MVQKNPTKWINNFYAMLHQWCRKIKQNRSIIIMHREVSKNCASLVQHYLPTINDNFEKFVSKLSNKIRRVVCIIGAFYIPSPNYFASFCVTDC